MATITIFRIHLALGYLTWALCTVTYVLPWLKAMERAKAHRAIATLHSFRFFGLVFILPGVVGSGLPPTFAEGAAYGDLATSILAILALLTFRIRPLFWAFVVGFNLVGAADLILDTAHAIRQNVPAIAGQLGAAYAIPILYVPLLMLTHLAAFYLLLRPASDDQSALKNAKGAR
jgi:hypothetical protein